MSLAHELAATFYPDRMIVYASAIILAPLLLLGVYRQSRIAPPGEAVAVQGPVPD